MSSNLLGFPPVIVFGVLAFMVLRSRRVSMLDVFIFVLFGFYLGTLAGVAHFINSVIHLVPGIWSGGHG